MPADELTLELAQQKLVDRLHWFQLDRRDFLKLCGGGLLVCLGGASDKAQEAGGGFREHELPQEVSAWVHIDEGGNDYGLHRQSGSGTEHSNFAGAACGRRTPGSFRHNHNGDG